MATMLPTELYGLALDPNGDPVPAMADDEYPATIRITMAAIDPTEKTPAAKGVNGADSFVGSTLRIIRVPNVEDESDEDSLDGFRDAIASDDDSDDEEDDDEDDDEDEDDDDEDVKGGPSDPNKSPKALKAEKLRKELENPDNEIDMVDVNELVSKINKGKARASDSDDDEDEDESDGPDEPEEFVICTLDPSKAYQQPLDITINEHEIVYFQANGTHKIYLTGNVLTLEEESDEEDEMGYDMEPDVDEIGFPDIDEDESDELDDIEDPRVTEIDSDDDDGMEIPKLVKANIQPKGKNKRLAEDESDEGGSAADGLSKILKPAEKPIVNGTTPQQQLSKSQLKKQRKKMKDNNGNAVEPIVPEGKEDIGVAVEAKKEQTDAKSGKKVQFAANIIQGPTNSSSPKPEAKRESSIKADESTKPNSTETKTPQVNGTSSNKRNIKVVDGVTIDDRKVGAGKAAKKGDKVSMRYIGKLEKDKKQFDANKKGAPFQFRLGSGEVIKGWDIGVAGMAVGGERRITVPARHAYGDRKLPDIPANSTLIFDVKLLKID